MSFLSFTPSVSVTVQPSLTAGTIVIPGIGRYMRFANYGTGNVGIAFYEPGQAAPVLTATNAMLIPGGAIEVFSVASDQTQVAFLGDSTGTTLCITRGVGI